MCGRHATRPPPGLAAACSRSRRCPPLTAPAPALRPPAYPTTMRAPGRLVSVLAPSWPPPRGPRHRAPIPPALPPQRIMTSPSLGRSSTGSLISATGSSAGVPRPRSTAHLRAHTHAHRWGSDHTRPTSSCHRCRRLSWRWAGRQRITHCRDRKPDRSPQPRLRPGPPSAGHGRAPPSAAPPSGAPAP